MTTESARRFAVTVEVDAESLLLAQDIVEQALAAQRVRHFIPMVREVKSR